MDTNRTEGRKPLLRRGKAFIATLGITAALAGVAMPAAFPVSAAAEKRSEWCLVLQIAYDGALERYEGTAAAIWEDMLKAAGCW